VTAVIAIPRAREKGMTLVELLVAMVVMGVITTLIIGSWIALTKSYSSTSKSNRQRDFANLAIARLAREIRDAQSIPGGTTTAFVRAYPDEIRFYSTFNTAGAADPTTTPRLTRFVLRETDASTHEGAIYREFPGADGVFDTSDDVSALVVEDVVNLRTGDDLFRYSAIHPATGDLYLSEGETTLVPPARIQTVSIVLQVDLNPGRSPNYMDIATTIEPRNVRHL
jgi:prepilin-type N-terminal cleavage/methylation domain-containing protein